MRKKIFLCLCLFYILLLQGAESLKLLVCSFLTFQFAKVDKSSLHLSVLICCIFPIFLSAHCLPILLLNFHKNVAFVHSTLMYYLQVSWTVAVPLIIQYGCSRNEQAAMLASSCCVALRCLMLEWNFFAIYSPSDASGPTLVQLRWECAVLRKVKLKMRPVAYAAAWKHAHSSAAAYTSPLCRYCKAYQNCPT